MTVIKSWESGLRLNVWRVAEPGPGRLLSPVLSAWGGGRWPCGSEDSHESTDAARDGVSVFVGGARARPGQPQGRDRGTVGRSREPVKGAPAPSRDGCLVRGQPSHPGAQKHSSQRCWGGDAAPAENPRGFKFFIFIINSSFLSNEFLYL